MKFFIPLAVYALCATIPVLAQTPQYYTPSTGSFSTPFLLTKAPENKTQLIYKSIAFPGAVAGNIISVYLKSGSTHTNVTTISDFTIKLGYRQTDRFEYSRITRPTTTPPTTDLIYLFVKTGLTTVFNAPSYTTSAPVSNGQWLKFPLQTSFAYKATTESNLLVEIAQGPDTPINGINVGVLSSSMGKAQQDFRQCK